MAVAEVTEGFVGAEINAIVPDALYAAYQEDERAITTEDLKLAASKVAPLSRMASEKINALREWAKGRTRRASALEVVAAGNMVRTLDL
jgi:SpoVK/Ycf46/Vps4 family AAA+-type ATPase